ncbi:hypothetical protein BD289DRAFT_445538 [Coniella lustricola]|uniref:Uncharacterized protein n=1 Tax=Coniella lustricola TaxID=2025994 RepID=A0A2T2ZUR9_9PEZI|nr:hypothetical protein BD289DRAFT_445538 [Coniella lustricola]
MKTSTSQRSSYRWPTTLEQRAREIQRLSQECAQWKKLCYQYKAAYEQQQVEKQAQQEQCASSDKAQSNMEHYLRCEISRLQDTVGRQERALEGWRRSREYHNQQCHSSSRKRNGGARGGRRCGYGYDYGYDYDYGSSDEEDGDGDCHGRRGASSARGDRGAECSGCSECYVEEGPPRYDAVYAAPSPPLAEGSRPQYQGMSSRHVHFDDGDQYCPSSSSSMNLDYDGSDAGPSGQGYDSRYGSYGYSGQSD